MYLNGLDELDQKIIQLLVSIPLIEDHSLR